MPDSCVFCRVVKGEIPSARIFESNSVIAFLDIAPAARGHALVIPKKHFETISDVPERDLREMIVAVKNVASAVVDAAEADGFNIIQSNKQVAGQVIPHVHFHIIPRKEGDDLSFEWEHIELDKEELEALMKKVKSKIRKK
ncbi:MAG: HIT family protein [Candidatus ainarchaeum sp.]|nr:HIT family protein [Candidatus ainarchaeum sp.]